MNYNFFHSNKFVTLVRVLYIILKRDTKSSRISYIIEIRTHTLVGCLLPQHFLTYDSPFRGFKALKQTVKLYYRLGKYKEMMEAYREMLTYIKSAVTRNYSEKCINNIMDFVSGSASHNFDLLQEFYQTTLRALEEAKNEVRCYLAANLVGICLSEMSLFNVLSFQFVEAVV